MKNFWHDFERDLDETLVSTRELNYRHLRRDENHLRCENCVACYTPNEEEFGNHGNLAWCDEQECFIDKTRKIEDWCDLGTAEIDWSSLCEQ